jgi:hypothetical protein
MLRTVCEAFVIAVRIASSELVVLLPTISLNRYTWSLTGALLALRAAGCGSLPRAWHERACRARLTPVAVRT